VIVARADLAQACGMTAINSEFVALGTVARSLAGRQSPAIACSPRLTAAAILMTTALMSRR
jgi:hypothetical protein